MSGSLLSKNGDKPEEMEKILVAFAVSDKSSRARRERERVLLRRKRRLLFVAFVMFLIATYALLVTYA